MAITATRLFGSWARGDQTDASDTDLLLMTDDPGPPRHGSWGRVSFSYYSLHDLEERADDGDLFLWHVLFEGRALYDPLDQFTALQERFRLRASYAREIGHGAAMGWFLVHFGERYLHSALAARRATWAVRSILISRAAEAGQPRFAAEELAALAPLPETRRLLLQKTAPGLAVAAICDMRRFLDWAGLPDPLPGIPSEARFGGLFAKTRNTVGLHFMESARRGEGIDGYT